MKSNTAEEVNTPNVDALSRLPCNELSQPLEQSIWHFTTIDDLPISSKEIREATRKDPTLSRVLDYTLNGWSNCPGLG